jgi:hypothetical protein
MSLPWDSIVAWKLPSASIIRIKVFSTSVFPAIQNIRNNIRNCRAGGQRVYRKSQLIKKIKRCIIFSMKRTQIQIPEPLYREVKRLAALRDWSVSEVFRRAVEQLVAQYPKIKKAGEWRLPEPRSLGEPRIPTERWRDLLGEDESGQGNSPI